MFDGNTPLSSIFNDQTSSRLMRYRITFAFQLWWYFDTRVEFWIPFHEYKLGIYDKYEIKVNSYIDPCEKVVIKIDSREFWYHREAFNQMRKFVEPQ